jgi:hypothetical protein
MGPAQDFVLFYLLGQPQDVAAAGLHAALIRNFELPMFPLGSA